MFPRLLRLSPCIFHIFSIHAVRICNFGLLIVSTPPQNIFSILSVLIFCIIYTELLISLQNPCLYQHFVIIFPKPEAYVISSWNFSSTSTTFSFLRLNISIYKLVVSRFTKILLLNVVPEYSYQHRWVPWNDLTPITMCANLRLLKHHTVITGKHIRTGLIVFCTCLSKHEHGCNVPYLAYEHCCCI